MTRLIPWPAWLLAGCLTVAAQETSRGYFPVDPVNLIRYLIGPDASFSALAEITGLSTNGNDDFVLTADYAILEGQLRTVVDLAQIRGLNACDIAQGRLQHAGMDLAISIKLPRLKRAYTIYPRARAYIEVPLTWREELKELVEVTKTKLGDDTVDGHPCVKYRAHSVNKMGDEFDFSIWEATDLGNFPVQLRFETAHSTFNIRFHHIQRTPPAIELFQPPDDYDRYTSPRDLSQAIRGR